MIAVHVEAVLITGVRAEPDVQVEVLTVRPVVREVSLHPVHVTVRHDRSRVRARRTVVRDVRLRLVVALTNSNGLVLALTTEVAPTGLVVLILCRLTAAAEQTVHVEPVRVALRDVTDASRTTLTRVRYVTTQSLRRGLARVDRVVAVVVVTVALLGSTRVHRVVAVVAVTRRRRRVRLARPALANRATHTVAVLVTVEVVARATHCAILIRLAVAVVVVARRALLYVSRLRAGVVVVAVAVLGRRVLTRRTTQALVGVATHTVTVVVAEVDLAALGALLVRLTVAVLIATATDLRARKHLTRAKTKLTTVTRANTRLTLTLTRSP